MYSQHRYSDSIQKPCGNDALKLYKSSSAQETHGSTIESIIEYQTSCFHKFTSQSEYSRAKFGNNMDFSRFEGIKDPINDIIDAHDYPLDFSTYTEPGFQSGNDGFIFGQIPNHRCK